MASTHGPYELGCGTGWFVSQTRSLVMITDSDCGVRRLARCGSMFGRVTSDPLADFCAAVAAPSSGGRRCDRSAVGSLLVFEPGVAGSVDERHVTLEAGGCVSGPRLAVRRAPAKSTLSSSSATALTKIPKRNNVPVDPVR